MRLSALGLALLLAGCSGSSGGSGGAFYVESCTLGCANGVGGSQVGCEIVNVGRNVEISVLFSQPIDPTSLSNTTIRIINATTSQVPPFAYSIDPNNPRRLIARPALTFDTLGNPVFALGPDETYEVTIPGISQGDEGPYVRSIGGRSNLSRLKCTIRTTEGLNDFVPGPPSVTAVVDTLTANNVPAHGATGVKVSSSVRMTFNDIMNPATLANPSTGQATFITIRIDTDGNIATTADQVPIGGTFVWNVDFNLLRTTLVFTPTAGFPSKGSNPGAPRRVVVNIPASVTDLVGNPLANPGLRVFEPEEIVFDPLTLPQAGGETFQTNAREDIRLGGANWGGFSVGGVNGRLSAGRTGGSGRLGRLVVRTGQTLVLDTDSQEFPLPGQVYDLMSNVLEGDYDPLDPSTWPRITVTDGAFEFAQLVIENNARLILRGSQPGRIYSRGDLVVNGVLDVSGETPAPHQSNDWKGNTTNWPANVNPDVIFGGQGGAGGPSAGSGGQGGDRYNHNHPGNNYPSFPASNFGNIWISGANPDQNPGTFGGTSFNHGRAGGGIANLYPAGGQGGLRHPPTLPVAQQLTNQAATIGELGFTRINSSGDTVECRVSQVGGPGGGGAYALDGGAANPASPFQAEIWPGLAAGVEGPSSVPTPTPGGDNSSLALEPPGQSIRRGLSYEQGNLVGGSGGGGGGMHIWGTRSNATGSLSNLPACRGASGGATLPYWDHSGAGGGGGGGAVQVNSGRSVVVTGVIDASGGAGGSSTNPGASILGCTSVNPDAAANVTACGHFAAPGGGGSGGALKVRARSISLASVAGRLDVRGGVGGSGVGGSVGGAGSPGLVRLEYSEPSPGNPNTDALDLAPRIAPFLPNVPSFNSPFQSAAILSIGGLAGQRVRPDSFTASTSCWMKPEGNFFLLTFDDDEVDAPGWSMDIVYNAPSGTQRLFPYRGIPSTLPEEWPLVGQDFEEYLGNLLNHDLPLGTGSLIAVRFQGARAVGTLTDPCNTQLSGVGSQIVAGSLTPWVRHPAELNHFDPVPNMVRFTVIFEDSLKTPNSIESRILGVTNLAIRATPD